MTPLTSSRTSPICPVRPGEEGVRVPADHLPDDPAGVGPGHVLVGDDRPVAQDGHVVADPAELVELVRDVDDRDVVAPQVLHHAEQDVDLVVGQCRGRLVHDEDPHVLQEDPGDLHQLLLADRQVPHHPVGVEVLTQTAQHLGGPGALGGVVDEPSTSPELASREQVLGDRHVREQAQLLVDDPDAEPARVPRAVDRHRLTVEQDRARARLLRTGEDLHQRRLARPVLADEHVHTTPERLERHALERLDSPIGLGHVDGAQDDLVVGRRATPAESRGTVTVRRDRAAGRLAHDAGSSSVGTTRTEPGATSENAPAKSTFFPTRLLASTPARTSPLTLLFSSVATSA